MTRADVSCLPGAGVDDLPAVRVPGAVPGRDAGSRLPSPSWPERYRPRMQRDFEEGRLGSVWGFVPHRPDQTHVRLNPPQP